MIYVVKGGDTMSAIARAHGLSLVELVRLNPQYRGREDAIRVGAKLAVPGPEGSGANPADVSEAEVAVPANGLGFHALGKLSGKYETGGRGPSTVSTGKGDRGGVSYGSYQMTSRPEGGTVAAFIASPEFPYPAALQGLLPGTSAFTAQWKALVSLNPESFAAAEHSY